MPTEKRHIYSTGTVNVETGNVVVKQDINYFNANDESAMKSIIRYIEDEGQKFRQNQIYDGLGISALGAPFSGVAVATGNGFLGGRWGTVDSANIDFTGSGAGDYHVLLRMSPNLDTPRNPSTGETFTIVYEPAGSFSYDDNDLFLGHVNLSSTGVVGTVNSIGSRRYDTRFIRPYGTSTTVSVLTGTAPAYISAFDFQSSVNKSNIPLRADAGFSGTAISGSSLVISDFVDIIGNFGVGANTYLSGTLQVDGVTNLYDTLNVTSDTYLSGTLKTDGQVELFDKLYVTSDSYFSGTSRVTGRSDVEGVFEVGGAVHLSGTLEVDSATHLKNNLYVTNNTILSGTLDVDGVVNFYGTDVYTQRLYVSGTIGADGIIESQSYLSGTQFHSNVAGGTPPLVVQSTTKVANLNADFLDDLNTGATSGSIPINDGVLNVGLNADILDGQEGSYYSVKTTTDAHAALVDEHLNWKNQEGVSQLSSSISSTSIVLSANSLAAKTAYDVGNHSHPYAATSHTHDLSDVNIDKQIYNAGVNYMGISNSGITLVQNDEITFEVSIDSQALGQVFFAVPYISGRTVASISIGGKSNVTRTIKGAFFRRTEIGSSTIGSETDASWNSTDSNNTYTINASSTNENEMYYFRLRETGGLACVLNITNILITYSN